MGTFVNGEEQMGIQVKDLDMGTHKIINMADPSADQDADTKIARDAGISTHAGLVVGIHGLRGNRIGEPGRAGFGVGICPPDQLPADFTPLSGYTDPTNANYGNYQYIDGSIMVWIPKFYYRIAHAENPTYGVHGVNSVDIRGIDVYASTAAANADEYALHRAFIDGGVEKDGFFVDKYKISKVAKGSGFVGASIQNGNPISTAAAHNQISDLSSVTSGNIYASMIEAAKGRSGANGVYDANSIFFCCSRFIHAALALLSLAHGQASTATTYCAWYNGTYNFPKGCNDDALGDINDATIDYVSDGYSNCGKTGSGTPFAKTTHNGQACGVADLNGLIYEVSIGITCIATTKLISAATKANPCQITVNGHGRSTGDVIRITEVVGMTQLNTKLYKVTYVDDNNLTLDGVDSSAYSDYTSDGTITHGMFYVAKQATAMKNFTSGTTLATDHWGATGVAAMMDALAESVVASMFKVTGGGIPGLRYGSGANQVLDEALSGAAWIKTGLGMVKTEGSIDASGTNLFGQDYYYQYIMDNLCLLSCAHWGNSTGAGVWCVYWGSLRTVSDISVGGRFACYPV